MLFKCIELVFIKLRIYVEVKAGAKIEKVEKINDSFYIVWVKAPRIKGKANEAVIKTLKTFFKKQVRLVAGKTSTKKIVDVDDE